MSKKNNKEKVDMENGNERKNNRPKLRRSGIRLREGEKRKGIREIWKTARRKKNNTQKVDMETGYERKNNRQKENLEEGYKKKKIKT